MRAMGLLAGLAAVLAALVMAGGDAVLAERTARANNAVTRLAGGGLVGEAQRASGFFAGAGLTSPL